jgi:predicted HTH transcriptional regulator
MSTWTKERIEKMITDRVEESLTLDYKRAASLEKSDDKRTEITKDVSSFANSSGGTIIYGVAESAEKDRRCLPERPDPVQRAEISKEWLEQVIQTIQPRIDGFQIHPVTWDEQANTVCYVVEIQQSNTARDCVKSLPVWQGRR